MSPRKDSRQAPDDSIPTPEPDSGTPRILPLLPLRDTVILPGHVVPLPVGRPRSVAALAEAARKQNDLLLVAQKDPSVEMPGPEDLYGVGTIAAILKMEKQPDGSIRVLVESRARARILGHLTTGIDACMKARCELMPDESASPVELEAIVRPVRALFENYVRLNKRIPPELLTSMASMENPSRLCDAIASQLPLKLAHRQELLEEVSITRRLERLYELMQREIEIIQVEKKIRSRVKKQMEKSQREYYLNEQMHAIQKELGERDEFKSELDELAEQIKAKDLPKEAADKAGREFKKLRMMSPMSPEATIVRNYLDWILALPWNSSTEEHIEIAEAERILDEDHFGLRKVKERILEYLAVQSLSERVRGPILCFVGPPGVGKTSLGRSIARATGRKFVRLSLGGVRDEAEIRGHRRTYIGAMPGKIIQAFKKAGAANPVFLLDEVDKLAADFRGDPAAALLEVLDPEQNSTFNDHYLDLDYDLSRAMFICTANTLDGIPPALRDRLEIIRLAGYTEPEKRSIARRYLIPKKQAENGLSDVDFRLTPRALSRIINGYTREAGVRSLEREISRIFRKIACRVLREGKDRQYTVTSKDLTRYLGVRKFSHGEIEKEDRVGLVTGLAWTELGGEMLVTEATLMPGKGKLIITGKLGTVMQESAQAALSYVRSRAERLGIDSKAFENLDLHIHVPEGAIPKDGPSAGITMATTMISAYTRVPVRKDVAMTGEITLRGRVLPIGGLKEKAMAAHRGGIKTILIPRENRRNVREIPRRVREDLRIIPVEHMDDVLKEALLLDNPESFLRGPDEMVPEAVIELSSGRTPIPAASPAGAAVQSAPASEKKPAAAPAAQKSAGAKVQKKAKAPAGQSRSKGKSGRKADV